MRFIHTVGNPCKVILEITEEDKTDYFETDGNQIKEQRELYEELGRTDKSDSLCRFTLRYSPMETHMNETQASKRNTGAYSIVGTIARVCG